MAYDLTNLTSGAGTSFQEFAVNVSTNILGGYMIGWIIMLIIFSVFFLSLKTKGYYTSTSLAVACWMTTLVTLLLKPMGLIDDYTWWVGIIITPMAIFVLFMASAQN